MLHTHPTPQGQPKIPANGASAAPKHPGVFPIRSATPARTTKPPHTFPRPRTGLPVPVARRPWRVLLIPPTPGARTRTFRVSRWQARIAIATIGTLALTGGGTLAIALAGQIPDPFATHGSAREMDARLAALGDSLSLARLALAGRDDPASGSPSATGAGPSATGPISTLSDRLSTRRRAFPPSRTDLSATKALSRIAALPVIGAIVSEFSRARQHPLLHVTRPHLGVDVSAPAGTPVFAPAAGRVRFVGRQFSYGLMVEVEHANGVVTRYAHLRSADVAEGAVLARGSVLGRVGSSGLTTGPHLHYETIVNGRAVDPLSFRMPQVGDSAPTARASAPAAGTRAGPREEGITPLWHTIPQLP